MVELLSTIFEYLEKPAFNCNGKVRIRDSYRRTIQGISFLSCLTYALFDLTIDL